jgi:hypothetical protein
VDAQPLHDAVLVERVPARGQLPRRQPVVDPYRGKADRALLIAAAAVNALLGLGDGHGRELDAAARLLAPAEGGRPAVAPSPAPRLPLVFEERRSTGERRSRARRQRAARRGKGGRRREGPAGVTPGANGGDGDGECAQPNGRGEDEDRLEELHVPGARCLGPGHGVRARIRTTRFHGINASLSLSSAYT